MPTYDYRCERCNVQFELWQSFSDDTLVTCPVEGGPEACQAPGEGPVKKVFSKVGIAFKGEGFYKTDHGSASRSRSEEKSGSKEDSSGSKSDGAGSKSDSSSSKPPDPKTVTSSSSSD